MRKRILVVDDDEMNLKRTRMILEKHYNVLLADSGREALEKIKREKIDLILLDIAMSLMDGIETFRRMKEFWNRAQEGGRKSFRREELNPEFILRPHGGYLVPYLGGIQKVIDTSG